MNNSATLVYLSQLLISSLVVFFAIALLIEFCFFFFGIKNARIRSFLRLLPILKLPFDVILHSISHRTPFMNLNPFSCESYYQKFIFRLMPLNMGGEESLHLSHWIDMQIPSAWLKLFMILFFAMTLGMMVFKIFKIVYSNEYAAAILQNAVPCRRKITNTLLQHALAKTNARILISKEIDSPLAMQGRYILFPKMLMNQLSQDEYEAVVAHELEHLRWRDHLIKIVAAAICTIFWWVPTAWWRKKMDNELEQAADSSLIFYSLNSHSLATAVLKVIRKSREAYCEPLAYCRFITHKSTAVARIQSILSETSNQQVVFQTHCIIGTVICSFTLISFWVC